MEYELSAFLFIGGFDCAPSKITERVNVKPTETSDEPKPGAKIPDGWQTWTYKNQESDQLSSRTIEQGIEALLIPIMQQSNRFAELPEGWVKEIVVTIYTNDDNSYVQISNRVMSLISLFAFDIKVAVYYICQECEKYEN